MSERKIIHIGYRPRDQFKAFHRRKQRWSALVCHRRAGKTVATLNDLIRGAVNEGKHEGRYAFIFPQRNQAKDTAWRYLRRYAEPLLAKPPNESELRVDLINGSMIRLYGADNPDALRGPYLDGVVLDEFADMKPEVWHEVVRPMLADRQGWATFIGTPKGKNEFWRLYESAKKDPAWFHMMLKASESGIIGEAELADLRKEMSEDQYQQEFECSFEAAIKGAFYADEMRTMLAEGRICPIEINKDVKTHTAWDLGVSDSTAIWFIQCVGRERRLVDYYEASGVGLDHYAQVLNDKRREHGWKYGDHYMPHDIKHRELTTGRSRLQALNTLGIDAVVIPESSVLDGINVVRRMLGRTWIDVNRCERGIEALRQYRREYDDKLKDWRKNMAQRAARFQCDPVLLRPLFSPSQNGRLMPGKRGMAVEVTSGGVRFRGFLGILDETTSFAGISFPPFPSFPSSSSPGSCLGECGECGECFRRARSRESSAYSRRCLCLNMARGAPDRGKGCQICR